MFDPVPSPTPGPMPSPMPSPTLGPILGIDPGLARCGYGAVRRDGGALHTVAYGVVRTDTADELPGRLAVLEDELAALVRELRPSAVAVERVLFQLNARTAISVGQASGLALVVAARAGVPVTHYSPNEVKLAVAGYGGADKVQVQQMVMRLLGMPSLSSADAADALALAICHAFTGRARAAVPSVPDGADGYARAVAAALGRDAST